MRQTNLARGMRFFTVFVCLGIAVACLALTAAAKPVEIEFFVAPAWLQPGFDAYQQIAEMFNQSQDEVHVNLVQGVGNYEEQVMTRVVGGAAPDVINSVNFGDIAPKGILRPLDDFIKKDNMLKLLMPPAIEQSMWDGQMLRLPQVAQPFITYYNPTLFGLAGVADPYSMQKSGKWNWDAVTNAARKISADKDGDGKLDVWGTATPVHWQQRTILWVVQAGGKYFDRWVNPTKATYDTPGVVQALEYLNELVQKQAMPYEGASTANHVPKFVQGNNGMIFEGPWVMGNIRKANTTDWDLAPVPKGPANAGTVMVVDGLQMLNTTAHPEAAWKWMQYLVLNQEAITVFTQATGRPPAALRGLQSYLKTVVVDGKPSHTDALADAMMNPIVGPVLPIVANLTAIQKAFTTEIVKYLKSEQSLQASLIKINDAANIVIQEVKAAK